MIFVCYPGVFKLFVRRFLVISYVGQLWTYLHCYHKNGNDVNHGHEAGELIKIRYNFQNALPEFWVKAMIPLLTWINLLKHLALRQCFDVTWDSANGKTLDKSVFQSILCHMTWKSSPNTINSIISFILNLINIIVKKGY